jgi:hypothetical protein
MLGARSLHAVVMLRPLAANYRRIYTREPDSLAIEINRFDAIKEVFEFAICTFSIGTPVHPQRQEESPSIFLRNTLVSAWRQIIKIFTEPLTTNDTRISMTTQKRSRWNNGEALSGD